MKNESIILRNSGYLLFPVARSHGWLNLSPAKTTDNGFRYSCCLGNSIPITLDLMSRGQDIVCSIDRILSSVQSESVKRSVARILSFDFPVETFLKKCRELKNKRFETLASLGWGRLLRSATPWEDAVKTLCTTNSSWPYTQNMCKELCETLGKPTPSGEKVFPMPKDILLRGTRFLRNHVKMGYRIKSLVELAERAESEPHWLLGNKIPSESSLYSEIKSWHGFGEYATNHLMVLLGHYAYLPVDREVLQYLGSKRKGVQKKVQLDAFSEWGSFRFVAYKLSRILARQNWIGD